MNGGSPSLARVAYTGPASHNTVGVYYSVDGSFAGHTGDRSVPANYRNSDVVIVEVHLSTFGLVTAHQRYPTCRRLDHKQRDSENAR